MSKGDKPRPLSVSYDEYSKKWDDIFGKKDTTEDNVLYDGLGTDIEQELEAEKRIDIIGQNGNDGLHYEEVDGES
tara:strand:- start:1010 stop:1234 length:225 start_codon:yes stop_codon:yes gene_type:complete